MPTQQAEESRARPPSAAGRRAPGVLLMARTLDQGGVERDVAKIATYLDRARFTPHVSTFRAGGMRQDDLTAAGIPVLHLPVYSLASAQAMRTAAAMRDYIRRHDIQVVHSYDASGIFGAAVARLCRVPLVITSQLSYRDILDARTQRLLRWSDRYAHAVLTNCEAIRRYMIEREGVEAERVELCYNGVDTRQFYPAPAKRPEELTDASLVIGTVCALRPEKGLVLLQEAFASVRRNRPGMKLVMVGSGEELPRLRRRAAELDMTGASLFVPATSEVAPWLRAMDIFVLPSYSEAFSNSLLEAMACGCAVVGSRVGGTPELIGEDERGLLFEKGDAAHLARQLERLVASPPMRVECGARAAEFARTRLSIEIAAGTTASMYERLLRKRGYGSLLRHPTSTS